MEFKTIVSKEKKDNLLNYMPKDKSLRKLADFFSMFSDETRIKIISALSMSEMCVNDISKILGINQTTVSHQLKILRSAGAVQYRRDGKIIYYSIADTGINDCLLTGVNYIMEDNVSVV